MKYANKIMPDIIAELDASVEDLVGKYMDMRDFNKEISQRIKSIGEACDFRFDNTYLIYEFKYSSFTKIIRCVVDLEQDKRFKFKRKGKITNVYFRIEHPEGMEYPGAIELKRYLKQLDTIITSKRMVAINEQIGTLESEVQQRKKWLCEMERHLNSLLVSLKKVNNKTGAK